MSEQICIHCYISGKVQGVFFRANTKAQAEQLELKGWVKNVPDGTVEVFACGSKEKIAIFYEWLQKGPERASVINASYEELDWQLFREFEIR